VNGRLLASSAVAAVFCASAVGAQTGRAEDPPAAVQYVALLTDARDALDATPPDVARARATVRALSDPGSAVTRGTTAADALHPIAADLDRNPPDVVGARQRLDATINALRLPDRSVRSGDGRAASDLLHETYRSPVFRDLDAHADESLLERIGKAVRRALGGHSLPDGLLGAVLGALLVGAVIGLVVVVMRRAGMLGRTSRSAMLEPPGTTVDPDAEWRAAEAAAVAGDHREAIRRAFRSALLSVAVRGRLRVDPAWTTRELLARAGGDAALLGALAPAASLFELAWYSGRPISAAEWQVARARCAAVRALAGEAVPA